MSAEPLLSVRGLCKAFGALQVAQQIDLDLGAGDRVGLIGPNGAGKTTLVNLLTGVLKASAGSVMLGGRRIDTLDEAARVRAGIVRTHQINTLLNETSTRDNVALAIAERDGVARRMFRFRAAWNDCLEQAQARLEQLGLGASADRLVGELPYGHQRLLEIAIALSLRPRVLLLDEPAAGVPSSEAHAIHQAIDRLPREVAVLMIEHDMDLVFRFAQQIVVLVGGKVLVRGSPSVVRADPRVREVYLGRSVSA
ncbi:MAG TPA: ABC transporter ATP-binding protein [Caldimonas sp.]